MGIVKREIESIICDSAFALHANVGRQRLRQTEKQKRVVDEVRRNIKKDACAGAGALTPSTGTKLWAKAVVIRFKADDASQRAARNKLRDGLKIAVVAAILVNGEQTALLLRELNERDRLFQSGCERLVDQHIASGGQALVGKRIVRIIWRGDDDEANFLDGEEFIERADDAHIGIFLGGFVAAALQNSRQPQSRHGANHRRVEGAAG